MLSELLLQNEKENRGGPEFATTKYAFGDTDCFKVVIFKKQRTQRNFVPLSYL